MQTAPQARTNTRLAQYVDEGIALVASSGAANAWTYMAHKSVPPDVISRVLAYPTLRRTTQ